MEMDALRLWQKLSDIHAVHVVVRAGTPLHKRLLEGAVPLGLWDAIPFKGAFSFTLIARLRRYLTRHQIRTAIFFGASEMWSLYFAFLGTDIRLIVRHGTTKRHSKKDPLHRLIYSRVYAHVVLTDHLASNVEKIYPICATSRIVRIYPGFDFPPVPEWHPSPDGTLRILHVGRVAGGKGHIPALVACGALWHAGVPFHLTFAGGFDGEVADDVRAFADQLPYRNCITFLGHVSNVNPLFEDHDIFLFPSSGEGLSNAFIEALAAGLVCIAFANTVFPEYVALGFYLRLAPDNDEHALGTILCAVAEGFPLEHERSKQNIVQVRTVFSVDQEHSRFNGLLL